MTFNSVNKNWAARVGQTAEQQSFLGTTIESFTVTAGFGDSPSQCTVNLATDKDFNSDGTGLIFGIAFGDGSFAPVFNKEGETLELKFDDDSYLLPNSYHGLVGEYLPIPLTPK